MEIEIVQLIYECFPKHFRMGTARMKEDNETEEGNQKKIENSKK